MIITSPQLGKTWEFPDGTSDDEVAQAVNSERLMAANSQGSGAVGLAQLLQTGSNAFKSIAQAGESSIPAVGGKDVWGMAPEQLGNLNQTVQTDVLSRQRNRVQERLANQEAMEKEKDRQLTLKVEQQRLKNNLAERKLMEDSEKAKAEMG